ncbi:excalibur calcium-binding domain-containing protein [Streptomyces peucetius]|uniref:Excalibur calcium-binding domain-containing protein n=1 Tax=Streptomyces peucetius TaxID=1950 RepID=A0ABY6I5Q5_STRPE|nr:excalibur calcium-binding domain-containing protein [Streptomyces peucetius]UYQ62315.1 excalibur calcium-binding domain-containing protein [Streptomyces peucetius]
MRVSRIRARFVPVVCVVAMATALVGCGGDGGGGAEPAAATSSEASPSPEPSETPSPQAALQLEDDVESADAGAEIVLEVLRNDTVALAGGPYEPLEDAWDSPAHTLTVDTPPAHGTAEVDGTGITYTPTDGYGGADEFTYRVEVEGAAGVEAVSATAVVRITVTKPTPTPTPKPKPKPKPKPAVVYDNCDAARAAGAAPVHEGDPGYGPHLDRDRDGVGCEAYNGSGGTTGGSGGGGTSGGGSGSTYYANCSAARAAGAAPVRAGDPGYGRHLDRDGDGVGCE